MKVLHVAETIKGGVASVLRNLLRAQYDGRSGTVYCLIPDEHRRELGDIPGVRTYTFRRRGRNLVSLGALAFCFGSSLLDVRPDVVHIHSTFAGVVCRIVLFLMRPFRRPKVVYCPHGWSFVMDVGVTRRRLYALIERILLAVTDGVICVSRFERRIALNLGFAGEKLCVVYNGVPRVATCGAPRSDAREGMTRLLFIGRLDRQKGFDILIEAMRRLPADEYHLTVVGDSVEREYVKPSLANVSYTGWLAPAEIPAHILAADALVVPSRWEAFCLVAVEAQLMGLPVIAANGSSLPEVVVDGRTGVLFSPNSPEVIAGTIRRLSKPELRQMGAEAALAFRGRFTVEEMAGRTSEVYGCPS